MQREKYNSGDLRVTGSTPEDDEDDEDDYGEPYNVPKGTFYLPHSCDQWIIGSREDAIVLLKDITRLLGGIVG